MVGLVGMVISLRANAVLRIRVPRAFMSLLPAALEPGRGSAPRKGSIVLGGRLTKPSQDSPSLICSNDDLDHQC